jgi:hypothetical protein
MHSYCCCNMIPSMYFTIYNSAKLGTTAIRLVAHIGALCRWLQIAEKHAGDVLYSGISVINVFMCTNYTEDVQY